LPLGKRACARAALSGGRAARARAGDRRLRAARHDGMAPPGGATGGGAQHAIGGLSARADQRRPRPLLPPLFPPPCGRIVIFSKTIGPLPTLVSDCTRPFLSTGR